MLLLLDNHDSFTWNLVELLRRLDKGNVIILKPEELKISDLRDFDRIIFSPGPGLPDEQRTMYDILDTLIHWHNQGKGMIPVLGVCLGMQAIARYFGGSLRNLSVVNHGQSRKLSLQQPEHGLFSGIQEGTVIGLYHSWVIDQATLPDCLEILALSDDGLIMAIAHKNLPICGVQFHPESFITSEGKVILNNWLNM